MQVVSDLSHPRPHSSRGSIIGMEKAAPTPPAHGAQKAELDPAVQAQIDQLNHMQLILQDTMQTQINLIQTHIYLANAAALDRFMLSRPAPPPSPFAPAAPNVNAATPAAPFAVPDVNAPPQLVPCAIPHAAAPHSTLSSSTQPFAPPAAPAFGAAPHYHQPVSSGSPASSPVSEKAACCGPGSPCSGACDKPQEALHAASTAGPRDAPHSPALSASSAETSGSPSPDPSFSKAAERGPVKRISLGSQIKFPTPVGARAPRETQEEGKFQCEHCSRVYTLQRSLIQHLKIHMDKCPYQCTDCGRRFSRKGHVDAHIRTHTQEKPYACAICAKSFNQKSGLARHLRSHNQPRIRRYRPVPL